MKPDTILRGPQPVEVIDLSEVTDIVDARSNFFQVIWLTSAGKALRLRPGEQPRLQETGNLEGFLIRIDSNFLEGLEHRLLLSAGPSEIGISNDTAIDLKYITTKMKNEIDLGEVLREDMLRRYTEIFLIYLARSVKEMTGLTAKTRNIELTESFMSLLDQHYKHMRMVADYASLLSVTPNYLNEIVKKITGQPAGSHIRQRVANEAKHQAVHSSRCMKEVAYALGFADIAHFSKFFKNATGRNFSYYKKQRIAYGRENYQNQKSRAGNA